MNEIVAIILINLEKVAFGIALFVCAYVSNIGLGAWKNVKIEGYEFNWNLIGQSIIKLIVLVLSISLLSIVVSVVPAYSTYIGIEIGAEVMEIINSLVIVSAFLTATIRYTGDAINKLKAILDN